MDLNCDLWVSMRKYYYLARLDHFATRKKEQVFLLEKSKIYLSIENLIIKSVPPLL